ncbi:hypothetical protein HPULCUR_011452 [Helicostylum pulchrum]|uniref:C2H2-type domain-containing protein n=1 Tax=Helicostylum pulchrum TaxID=562976 RepID=A0ABP9YG71_9FUNG
MSYNGSSQPGVKPKSYIIEKMKDLLDKDLVILDHGCYVYGRVFSSAAAARGHIKSMHGYDIPGRFVGIKRPPHNNYNYSTRTDTDEYDEAHYACPSCWFHCAKDQLAELHDHTVQQHNPRLINLESKEKYDLDIDAYSHSGDPAIVPVSLQNSRRSSLQSSCSSKSCQDYVSSDEEEVEVPLRRSNIRKVRISEDHKDVYSVNGEKKSELSQKINELRDLFHAMFT